jgi:DNA damage-inducible protein 1
MIQAEAGIPQKSQHIYHNGNLLADETKTVQQLQIVDGDMLALHVRDMSARQNPAAAGPSRQAAQRPQPQIADAETIRLRILGDAGFRAQVAAQQPDLVNAVSDPAAFARQYQLLKEREEQHKRAIAAQIQRYNEDPFDVEAQMKIEEMIREERVQENLQNAIEHNPEGQLHNKWLTVGA